MLDKKEAMHFAYPLSDKLFDVNLLEFVDLSEALGNRCISYYYSKYTNLSNVNCLIPISNPVEITQPTAAAINPSSKNGN